MPPSNTSSTASDINQDTLLCQLNQHTVGLRDSTAVNATSGLALSNGHIAELSSAIMHRLSKD